MLRGSTVLYLSIYPMYTGTLNRLPLKSKESDISEFTRSAAIAEEDADSRRGVYELIDCLDDDERTACNCQVPDITTTRFGKSGVAVEVSYALGSQW